jgi:hypothetical protein
MTSLPPILVPEINLTTILYSTSADGLFWAGDTTIKESKVLNSISGV